MCISKERLKVWLAKVLFGVEKNDDDRKVQRPNEKSTLKSLWYDGTEREWMGALNSYYYMLGQEQRKIDSYLERIDSNEVKEMSEHEFYDFLYDKYFVWKYTAKNRLATTRSNLEKYIKNGELHVLKDVQTRLFATSKNNVVACLKVASEIRGLGTAGASGLLAVLFLESFGTVDQFVVKRLREIDHPIYNKALAEMNPEGLKVKDGAVLIEIMKEKAAELNKQFNTDFWTPRKIDMVLWAYGR